LKMKHTLTLAAAACALLLVTAPAQAVLIDLNDFFADPTVTVSLDGTTATMNESSVISPVILSNIPSFLDPEVIVAGLGTILSFDYNVLTPFEAGDTFGAFVTHSANSSFAGFGISAGAGFDFLTASPTSGTVSFDLSALDGVEIGLEFQLGSLAYNVHHPISVMVSNVQLVPAVIIIEPGPDPVPEPGTMAIFGLGLAGLGFARRRKMVSVK